MPVVRGFDAEYFCNFYFSVRNRILATRIEFSAKDIIFSLRIGSRLCCLQFYPFVYFGFFLALCRILATFCQAERKWRGKIQFIGPLFVQTDFVGVRIGKDRHFVGCVPRLKSPKPVFRVKSRGVPLGVHLRPSWGLHPSAPPRRFTVFSNQGASGASVRGPQWRSPLKF